MRAAVLQSPGTPRLITGIPSPQVPIRTEVEVFPLALANEALARLRSGAVNGSVVIST
jgi:hypothetical protein